MVDKTMWADLRTADTCKARWRVLRDSFVRNQKKTNPSGSRGGSLIDWKYKDIISFILPHLQHRSSKINLEKVPDQSRSEAGTPTSLEEMDNQSVHVKIEDPGPGPSREIGSTITPLPQQATQRKKSKKRQLSTIADNLIALLEEPVPKQSLPESDLDECYYFAMSLVPMLNRMDRITREETKFQILKCFEKARQRQQHID
ncbi:uncharacterized protein LOC112160856 isoform X2 [Oryzias melastigma]|uniref:uncharacterized protein LOC112160856 isoform X2 n=1 Tax=Oryzias melastigma TaxID=30732 RepID=UPI000CF7E054|nr:uncharacterized protein LOC112160856 isoform X2 [Oryzias melastigma]